MLLAVLVADAHGTSEPLLPHELLGTKRYSELRRGVAWWLGTLRREMVGPALYAVTVSVAKRSSQTPLGDYPGFAVVGPAAADGDLAHEGTTWFGCRRRVVVGVKGRDGHLAALFRLANPHLASSQSVAIVCPWGALDIPIGAWDASLRGFRKTVPAHARALAVLLGGAWAPAATVAGLRFVPHALLAAVSGLPPPPRGASGDDDPAGLAAWLRAGPGRGSRCGKEAGHQVPTDGRSGARELAAAVGYWLGLSPPASVRGTRHVLCLGPGADTGAWHFAAGVTEPPAPGESPPLVLGLFSGVVHSLLWLDDPLLPPAVVARRTHACACFRGMAYDPRGDRLKYSDLLHTLQP